MRNSQECKTVRQNGAYKKSRKHEANLRRNPTLHFQIGLILSLLIAILFIEMRMPTKALNGPVIGTEPEPAVWEQRFQLEKIKTKEPVFKEKSKPQPSDQFEEVPDDTPTAEELFPNLEPDPEQPIDEPGEVAYEEPIEVPVDVDFIKIEQVPLYPGCEGLDSNEERRACMSAKITKLVSRKFKTEISEDLGLQGVNRIYVQFTIDKNGDVTSIKSRGSHPKLEAEAERVVNLIPKMTPGKQRNMPVGVIYNLPIKFSVQD